MTLSPKTLTSIAPLARSTILVRTSLIALLLALISMAQIPNMIDFELEKSLQSSKVSLRLRTEKLDPYFESLESSVNAKSEYEPIEDGEGDLVAMELDTILNVQLDLLVDPVGSNLKVIYTPSPRRAGAIA